MRTITMKIFTFIVFLAIIISLSKWVGSEKTLEERLQYSDSQVELVSDMKSVQDVQPSSQVQNNNQKSNLPNQHSDENTKIKYTYVPSYSHVYRNNGRPLLLESTLSVRNTDPQYSLRIHSVEYYDSKGKMLKSYVDETLSLEQLSSVEYLSEKMNEEGGFGAFFVVLWSSDNVLADPIIESVMIESTSDKQISFVSRGKTLPFKFERK